MVRNLITFIVSLFFLTACSTTSNEQIDEKALSNEDALSKSVEKDTNLNVVSDASDEANEALVQDTSANVKAEAETVSEAVEESGAHSSQVTAKQDEVETDNEKGLGSYLLLNNEPTKKVIKSLEGVTDTLNVLTFGIFATGHG
ncbi:conserved exported hypothetical protein [Vibrio crassostreae]|uniref:hypothetical protein n=1 Tax=Vibrio crassostreae TaxID=246167 RepID=UPI001049864A|nr:hypothetical protein [Vibrio crassostreae]TCT74063.1 hypothetical protein EDB46_107131 [Vibrio crassostreae]CAK1863032.1 conserved exported hypothetical protein [Vibrio crassostreae]CAK2070394.1 conserved exported hypothetical protein [Vibrio crassostreae]CAK2075572.1 conserved exported hypothetical protein [Vibrio crassostreae]CAK2111540.1 conserved exported hypothetical protein [Vibrio crassostreae]